MGDIQNWHLDLLNTLAIGLLVAIIIASYFYLTLKSIRTASPDIWTPIEAFAPRTRPATPRHSPHSRPRGGPPLNE